MVRVLPFVLAAVAARAASISAIVVDPLGSVIAGAKVVAINGNDRTEIESGKYGRFLLKDLKPGTYSIEISSPGFKTKAIRSISVDENDVALASIELAIAVVPACGPFSPADLFTPIASGRSELAGRVFLDGSTRAAGALVTIYDAKGVRRVLTHTDAEGRFLIPGLRAGLYQLRIRLPGYAEMVVDAVEIKRGFRSNCEPFILTRCPDGVACPNMKWTTRVLCL